MLQVKKETNTKPFHSFRILHLVEGENRLRQLTPRNVSYKTNGCPKHIYIHTHTYIYIMIFFEGLLLFPSILPGCWESCHWRRAGAEPGSGRGLAALRLGRRARAQARRAGAGAPVGLRGRHGACLRSGVRPQATPAPPGASSRPPPTAAAPSLLLLLLQRRTRAATARGRNPAGEYERLSASEGAGPRAHLLSLSFHWLRQQEGRRHWPMEDQGGRGGGGAVRRRRGGAGGAGTQPRDWRCVRHFEGRAEGGGLRGAGGPRGGGGAGAILGREERGERAGGIGLPALPYCCVGN